MTRKGGRQPPRAQQLSGARRLEARYMAEDMMAELQPEREVVRAIQRRFHCAEQPARRIYAEAFKGLAAAEASDRAERRGVMERALQRLYRQCWQARQYGVCARVAGQLKDLFGLDAPIKVEGLLAANRAPEDERTDQELDYYLEHGYWPEEAPRVAKAEPPRDPLAGLH